MSCEIHICFIYLKWVETNMKFLIIRRRITNNGIQIFSKAVENTFIHSLSYIVTKSKKYSVYKSNGAFNCIVQNLSFGEHSISSEMKRYILD